MGSGRIVPPSVLPAPREEDAAAAGSEPIPSVRPAAAALPAQVTDLRAAIAAEVAALRLRFPRWHIWYGDRGWQAFRMDAFREEYRPGTARYAVRAAGRHEFTVSLAAEDRLETPARTEDLGPPDAGVPPSHAIPSALISAHGGNHAAG